MTSPQQQKAVFSRYVQLDQQWKNTLVGDQRRQQATAIAIKTREAERRRQNLRALDKNRWGEVAKQESVKLAIIEGRRTNWGGPKWVAAGAVAGAITLGVASAAAGAAGGPGSALIFGGFGAMVGAPIGGAVGLAVPQIASWAYDMYKGNRTFSDLWGGNDPNLKQAVLSAEEIGTDHAQRNTNELAAQNSITEAGTALNSSLIEVKQIKFAPNPLGPELTTDQKNLNQRVTELIGKIGIVQTDLASAKLSFTPSKSATDFGAYSELVTYQNALGFGFATTTDRLEALANEVQALQAERGRLDPNFSTSSTNPLASAITQVKEATDLVAPGLEVERDKLNKANAEQSPAQNAPQPVQAPQAPSLDLNEPEANPVANAVNGVTRLNGGVAPPLHAEMPLEDLVKLVNSDDFKTQVANFLALPQSAQSQTSQQLSSTDSRIEQFFQPNQQNPAVQMS